VGNTTFLSDQETKIDLLNYEAIASTIVDILSERPDQPVTIGVHGDWGAGKSSILEMIEGELEGPKDILCLKFNGWRFQGFEDAKIVLLEGIVTGLLEQRPELSKAVEKVKSVFGRIDWLKVAKKAGGLALTAYTGIPSPGLVDSLVSKIQGAIEDPKSFATKENFESLLEGAQGLIKQEVQSKNVPEEINEFRKAFEGLLDEAKVSQLVVLIDDLDRCLPESAIETLEAIRLFVFTSRTAFVIAADESMIEYAVRKHFPDLPNSSGSQTYARNYLEKLIQVPFRIPALGETETRVYVTLLLVGAELGEADPDFHELITVAREKLRRPWISGALDAETVSKALGEKAVKAQEALNLSDQIGPILASGTKGNPRQVKRFLNSVLLRHRTAEARGFGDEVQVPILAKLMLAEQFLSHFFDQIAISTAISPDGLCQNLALLEKQLDLSSTQGPEDGEGQLLENPLVEEWLASKAICEWGKIRPLISGVDLRPYLFVAKDRKDYFAAVSALGHLTAIAEKLMGGKIAVQALEDDLRKIANPEADQLFEAVRSRIMSSGTFKTEPDGISGLTLLVKTHPHLQVSLVDFLERLPDEQLGPWVVSGWTAVLVDSGQNDRFFKLLERWARLSSSNKILRTTALSTIKTLQGGK